MGYRSRALCTGAAAIALVAIALSGCVDERAFYIQQNQVPQAGCQLTTDEVKFNSRGLLDVSVGVGYTLFPLVKLEALSSKATDQEPERNALDMRKFIVSLDMEGVPGSYPLEQTSFEVLSSGGIVPGGAQVTEVKIVPDALAQALQGVVAPGTAYTLVAAVTAVGVRRGTGSEIESTEFFYPVELCSGCLVAPVTACPADTTGLPTNECGLPQDDPVTCCTLSTGQITCLDGSS